MREALLRGKDWQAVAIQQARGHLGEASRQLGKAQLDALLKTFEYMADLEPGGPAGGAGAGGAQASAGAQGGPGSSSGSSLLSGVGAGQVKMDFWRKVGGGAGGGEGGGAERVCDGDSVSASCVTWCLTSLLHACRLKKACMSLGVTWCWTPLLHAGSRRRI